MGQRSPVHDPLRPSFTPCGPTACSHSPDRPTALQSPRLCPAAGPWPVRGQGIEHCPARGPVELSVTALRGHRYRGPEENRAVPGGSRERRSWAGTGTWGPPPRLSALHPFAFSVSRTSGHEGPRRLSLGWRSAQLLNDGAHSRARPRTRCMEVRRGSESGVFCTWQPVTSEESRACRFPSWPSQAGAWPVLSPRASHSPCRLRAQAECPPLASGVTGSALNRTNTASSTGRPGTRLPRRSRRCPEPRPS